METLNNIAIIGLGVMFIYNAVLLTYAVLDNRKVELWPPVIHSKLDSKLDATPTPDPHTEYDEFLNELTDVSSWEFAVLEILQAHNGTMRGYEFEKAMNERDEGAALEASLRGSTIVEGDLNGNVSLTELGNRAVRIRSSFQRVFQQIEQGGIGN